MSETVTIEKTGTAPAARGPQTPSPSPRDADGLRDTGPLGAFLTAVIVGSIVLMYQIVVRLPGAQPADGVLFLGVVAAGALGAFVHAATSLATFVGNRQYRPSWGLWYLLRPAIGAAMAVLFYLALRGGLVVFTGGGAAEAGDLNPYPLLAGAALAGMFSKQASDKLSEVFDTLFGARADAARKDKLHRVVPAIVAIDPAEVDVVEDGGEVKLVISGENFVDGCEVWIDGKAHEHERIGDDLHVKLGAAIVGTAGERRIVVVNPAQNGGRSTETILRVRKKVNVGDETPLVGGGAAEGEAGDLAAGDGEKTDEAVG